MEPLATAARPLRVAVIGAGPAAPAGRLFGNVTYGVDVHHKELKRFHDQIVYAVGAQADRRMSIPAVGNGNVAMDVARMLVTSPDALRRTDMAGHALEALDRSSVREVVVLGRRGAAQASFTTPELKELGKLEGSTWSSTPGTSSSTRPAGPWPRRTARPGPTSRSSRTAPAGQYVVGWAKRGPTGRIGNNKPDSVSTVEAMVADLPALKGVRDDHEVARGQAQGAPPREAVHRGRDARGHPRPRLTGPAFM